MKRVAGKTTNPHMKNKPGPQTQGFGGDEKRVCIEFGPDKGKMKGAKLYVDQRDNPEEWVVLARDIWPGKATKAYAAVEPLAWSVKMYQRFEEGLDVCMYEVVFGDHPHRVYCDIDANLGGEDPPTHAGIMAQVELMTCIMQESGLFPYEHACQYQSKVVMTSSTAKRISVHVVWPALIVKSADAHKHLFTKLRFIDGPATDHRPDVQYVDKTIYNSARCFRLLGSRKAKATVQKPPVFRLEGEPDLSEMDTRRHLLRTLVQYGVSRDTPDSEMFCQTEPEMKRTSGTFTLPPGEKRRRITPRVAQRLPSTGSERELSLGAMQRFICNWEDFIWDCKRVRVSGASWTVLGEELYFTVHSPGLPCPGKATRTTPPVPHLHNGSFGYANVDRRRFVQGTEAVGSATPVEYSVYCQDDVCEVGKRRHRKDGRQPRVLQAHGSTIIEQ
jgi:hypothetical protein